MRLTSYEIRPREDNLSRVDNLMFNSYEGNYCILLNDYEFS
jgi:hypothetical protein